MKEEPKKIVFTFRVNPKLKEAARQAARQAKLTLSKYVEDLVKLDLWRKGLLAPAC
jgi:predicted HicB family RNase H-like nuclease